MFQYIAFFEDQMSGFAQAIADLAEQNFAHLINSVCLVRLPRRPDAPVEPDDSKDATNSENPKPSKQ